jgi:Golgi apparatus protein 1
MKQRAISVDLMPDIEEPCLQDLAKYCSEDETHLKKGFEMECLQEKYEQLEKECQLAIGNFTEEESEHIELNYPLFKACASVVKEVCSDVVDRDIDQGDVIECLILNKNKAGVKKNHKCRVAIEHFQLLSLKDFRFSFKFKESCKSDVLNYCRTVKTKHDVVSCLSGIVFNDTMSNRHKFRISPDCKNQLRVELLQRSENIKLDPQLDKACESDRNQFCDKINPGESQVIECLKSNLHKLTKACQRIIFKRERIELNDNSVDYSLMSNCRTAISKFCVTSDLKDVLFCLRDHRDNTAMDQRCRSLVIKRLAEQNNDYRLNPRLKSACERDIPKFCAEIIETHKTDEQQLEGKVIACLKRQYVLNKLSQSCEIEVVNVIREVAQNVELDPILYKSCQKEIKTRCADDFDVQECLKIKFQNKEIKDESCKKQIARLINEVKADIQSDPLLHKVCVQDLKRYCSDIPAGHGRQLSCLLAVHESSSKLSQECKTMLNKRVEMFEYAAQVAPAESVAEVFKMVSSSPSRNYFLFVLFSFITFIFAGGLLCGRVTKRISANDKIK